MGKILVIGSAVVLIAGVLWLGMVVSGGGNPAVVMPTPLQTDTTASPTPSVGVVITFDQTGNLVRDEASDSWRLVYERPGAPGLYANLAFSPRSVCDGGVCNLTAFEAGQRVRIRGTALAGSVEVVSLITQ